MREFFFQNLTLGYMTKTLNQIIFFFLHQNQNIFLEKKHFYLVYVFLLVQIPYTTGVLKVRSYKAEVDLLLDICGTSA